VPLILRILGDTYSTKMEVIVNAMSTSTRYTSEVPSCFSLRDKAELWGGDT
jgi:hypothetical protein